jgi:hypothetical protein
VPRRGALAPLFLCPNPSGRRRMRKLCREELQKRRWLRALEIAKVLFYDQGYFDDYLCEIEQFIKGNKGAQEEISVKTTE